MFDWNAMSLDDLLLIHEIDFNELYERWKNKICERRACQHRKEDSIQVKEVNTTDIGLAEESASSSSCACNSEINRQPLKEETCSQLSSSSSQAKSIDRYTISNSESIIIEKLDNETYTAANEQLSSSDTNSRRSLFKLDKTTSMHSLVGSIEIASDLFTDLFIIEEKNSSRNRLHLGKHEHWIRNAMNSYRHPFADHRSEQCFNGQLN